MIPYDQASEGHVSGGVLVYPVNGTLDGSGNYELPVPFDVVDGVALTDKSVSSPAAVGSDCVVSSGAITIKGANNASFTGIVWGYNSKQS
jgi:hypothetical protein